MDERRIAVLGFYVDKGKPKAKLRKNGVVISDRQLCRHLLRLETKIPLTAENLEAFKLRVAEKLPDFLQSQACDFVFEVWQKEWDKRNR
jgi:hypothetical protein